MKGNARQAQLKLKEKVLELGLMPDRHSYSQRTRL